MTATETCWILENRTGDYLSSHDSLRWAVEEAKRLAAAMGKNAHDAFAIIQRTETDFESNYVRLNSWEWKD